MLTNRPGVVGSTWLDLDPSTTIVCDVTGPDDAPFADVTFLGPVELGLTMSPETTRRCRDLLDEALAEIDRRTQVSNCGRWHPRA